MIGQEGYPEQPTPSVRDVVHHALTQAGDRGRTSSELEAELSRGHGSVSSALTRLHRSDLAVRLSERRDRQYVYVASEFQNGRAVGNYTPHKGTGTAIQIPRQEVRKVTAMMQTNPRFAESHLAQFLGTHGIHIYEEG